MKAFLRRICLVLLFAGMSQSAWADYTFPALTGRVVDDAHILSSTTIQTLDQALAMYEQQSTNQIVVVTLPSLQGGTIEDYGYQLGRSWGIGQKSKDNGALLIIAPHERKVRIEVGYGLEGQLTDILSEQIIQTIILPSFRDGQMEQGVVGGTDAIVRVLGGHLDLTGLPHRPMVQHQGGSPLWILVIFFFLFILCSSRGLGFLPLFLLGSNGFGGSSSGGGFGGGGGSFGGGGASGGW